jgi:hypothetical protein
MATHDDRTPRGDESFGDAPTGDESMGDAPREPRPVPSPPPTSPSPTPAPPASSGSKTSLLIGGGIAILVLLAAIIGFTMK